MFSANPTQVPEKRTRVLIKVSPLPPLVRRDVPSSELGNLLNPKSTTDQDLAGRWGAQNKPKDARTRSQAKQPDGKSEKGQTSKPNKADGLISRNASTESRKASTAIRKKEAGGGSDRPVTGGDRTGGSKNPQKAPDDRPEDTGGDRSAPDPDQPLTSGGDRVEEDGNNQQESKEVLILNDSSTPAINTSDASAIAIETDLLDEGIEKETGNTRYTTTPAEDEDGPANSEADETERSPNTSRYRCRGRRYCCRDGKSFGLEFFFLFLSSVLALGLSILMFFFVCFLLPSVVSDSTGRAIVSPAP
jgi:hypothetical protein